MSAAGRIPAGACVSNDPWNGLTLCLDRGGGAALARIFLGLAAGWWLYVPLHELLHALGCVASGGTVSRLEIGALYGGSLLSRLFSFVTVGGEYAGRLSGFDTKGSDAVYLVTDLAPYLLTLWPGWWGLRRAGAAGAASAFGFWLPWALAPLISLGGDAYEIGALLVRQVPPWSGSVTASLLVGDDRARKAREVAAVGGSSAWSGFVLAALAGALWAWGWMALAGRVAGALGQPPLAADGSASVGNRAGP